MKNIFKAIFAFAVFCVFAGQGSAVLALTSSPSGEFQTISVGSITDNDLSGLNRSTMLPSCLKAGSAVVLWQTNKAWHHYQTEIKCAQDIGSLANSAGAQRSLNVYAKSNALILNGKPGQYCKVWVYAFTAAEGTIPLYDAVANTRPFQICKDINIGAAQIGSSAACQEGEIKVQTLGATNVQKILDPYYGIEKLKCTANAYISCANPPDGAQVNFYFTRGGYDAANRTFGGSGGINASARNFSMDFSFSSPNSQYCYKALARAWNAGDLGSPVYGEEVCCGIAALCNNNKICEPGLGETQANCFDCAPTAPPPAICNYNAICEPLRGETQLNCSDCKTITPPPLVCNYNSICESLIGETQANCSDCKTAVPGQTGKEAGYICFKDQFFCLKNMKEYAQGYLDVSCAGDLAKYFPGQTTNQCYATDVDCSTACNKGNSFFICANDQVCRPFGKYETSRACQIDLIGKYSSLTDKQCYMDEPSCINACSNTKKWYYCPKLGLDCLETDLAFNTQAECELYVTRHTYLGAALPTCYNKIENCRAQCLQPQKAQGFYCQVNGQCAKTANSYTSQELSSKCASDVAAFANPAIPGCFAEEPDCVTACKTPPSGQKDYFYVCIKDSKQCRKTPDPVDTAAGACEKYVADNFMGTTDGKCYKTETDCLSVCDPSASAPMYWCVKDLKKCLQVKTIFATVDQCSKYITDTMGELSDNKCYGKSLDCSSACNTAPPPSQCKKEGELGNIASDQCCAGLAFLPNLAPDASGNCNAANTAGYAYCGNVGDGNCAGKENICNSADCKQQGKKAYHLCVKDTKRCIDSPETYADVASCQSAVRGVYGNSIDGICYESEATCSSACNPSQAQRYSFCLKSQGKCQQVDKDFTSLADCGTYVAATYGSGNTTGKCYETGAICSNDCPTAPSVKKSQNVLVINNDCKTAQDADCYMHLPLAQNGFLQIRGAEFQNFYFKQFKFTADFYKEVSKYDTVVLMTCCPNQILTPAELQSLQKWVQEGGKLIRYNSGCSKICTAEADIMNFYKVPVGIPSLGFKIDENNLLMSGDQNSTAYINAAAMTYSQAGNYGENSRLWARDGNWCSDLTLNRIDTNTLNTVHAYKYYGKGVIIYNGLYFGDEFAYSGVGVSSRAANLEKIWLQELQLQWGEQSTQMTCSKPVRIENSTPSIWYETQLQSIGAILNPRTPKAQTIIPQSVSRTSATLRGNISNFGYDTGVSAYFFIYPKGVSGQIKRAGYVSDVNNTGIFSYLMPLNPGTTYYYTLRVYNKYGLNADYNWIEFTTPR